MSKICVPNNFESTNFEDETRDLDIFKGLTILVVDDDDNMRFFISEIFEIYGSKVMVADNALEAFELIEQFQLDLLISDINMPGENGYWLIRKVRTLTSLKKREIPAIAFSGNPEAKAHKKALASGFQTYIQKPSKVEQLVAETIKLLKLSVKRSPHEKLPGN
ncbi:response regulator [Nostoc sp. UHCC 0702]|nr:response regulator [Nostoc sp. UHCC 0702]